MPEEYVLKELPKKLLKYKSDPTLDSRLSCLSWFREPLDIPKTLLSKPKIRVTPSGISVNGFKLKMNLKDLWGSQSLRIILVLSSIAHAEGSISSYYFKDLASTVYKLWLSGVEDLDSAIVALRNGQCEVNTTDIVPKELELIENYYDHGGTVPLYAAVLARDKEGVTNQTVVDCVSGLIKEAHDAWQSDRVSPSAIAGIIGFFLALTLIAGFCLYCCYRKDKAQEKKDVESCAKLSSPN